MVSSKIIVSALVFVMIIGLSLTGTGITGMVVYDSNANFVGELCGFDNPCKGDNFCCFFYDQEVGVCQGEEMCDQVTFLTMFSNNKGQENILVSQNIENKMNNEKFNILYYKEFALGLLIIALAVAALYFFLKHHHHPVKQNIRKRKTKSKSHA